MSFIEPMLARAAEESDLSTKNWDGWVLEPKHDGMRAIVVRTTDGVEIYSRTGKTQKGKCPHLEEAFMVLPEGTVLDGELAMVESYIDVYGKQVPVVNFNKTMRVMGSGVDKAVLRQSELGSLSFIIFDVMVLGNGGRTLYETPQDSRFSISDSLTVKHMVHNPRFEGDFEEIYNTLIKAGVEGAILKGLKGEYLPGKRSKTWLKVKSAKTFDVVVTGFTEGQGKYEGQIGAIEFSAYDDNGSLNYVGRCSGMTDEERLKWTEYRNAMAADKAAGKPFPEYTVIEVKANEMVGSGEYRTPRHPQYQHIRVDKNPADCKMEQFKA